MANDGASGTELWRSNGQVPGTVRVKDINPGAGSSNATSFLNFNSTLFFAATNGAAGVELWQSSGFGPGTVLAADINPGAGSSNPAFVASSVTTLFFAASDGTNGTELWTLSNPLVSGAGAPAGFAAELLPGSAASLSNLEMSSAGVGLSAFHLHSQDPAYADGPAKHASFWQTKVLSLRSPRQELMSSIV